MQILMKTKNEDTKDREDKIEVKRLSILTLQKYIEGIKIILRPAV